jgi:hypothetical protein
MSSEFVADLRELADSQKSAGGGTPAENAVHKVIATGITSMEDLAALARDKSVPLETRGVAIWCLGRVKARNAGRELLEMAADVQFDLRVGAVRSLGFRREKQFAPALLRLLRTADDSLKPAILRALGYIGSRRCTSALLRSLAEETELAVRQAAVEGLAALRDPAALEPLITVLRSHEEPEQLRGLVAENLAYYEDPRAIGALINSLADESSEVRFWAAFSLGQLGNASVVPALAQLLGDDSAPAHWWSIGREAANAIQAIESRIKH